jgi:aminodeoxyfutalosine deaminase
LGEDSVARYIAAIPKAELHLHLEGSIEPETLLTLAERNRISLPWRTPEAIASLYRFDDFDAFKRALLLGVHCLRTADDFAFIAYRLGAALSRQNVCYAEVFWTPQFYFHLGPSSDDLLDALNAARARAKAEFGLDLRWIPDIVRSVPAPAMKVASWAASERARLNGVVALGLGGPEQGHPADRFAKLFAWARERGLPANPHAGEGTGPLGVRSALNALQPSRIGHGVGAAEDPSLLAELAAARLPLEVCVSSNVRLGLYRDAAAHPVKQLIAAGCVVTLNTDDPPLFHTSLNEEYHRAVVECGLTLAELDEVAVNAARASYLPEAEKKALVARMQTEQARLKQHMAVRDR